jgi:hypothetical protein
MPYKIAGQPGTWYEPGTRKGNVSIAWRGQLPDGRWTEFVTDSPHRPAAQAFVRRFLEKWHRDRPAGAGAEVDLAAAARHYKEARARSDGERDRVDRVVAWIGATVPVHAVNQTHLTAAAKRFRAQRVVDNDRARAEGRQTFPLPSTATVNREVTTPLRAVLNFAAEQSWRPKIVLRAVKPDAGETPAVPLPAARDSDVDRLLRAIEERQVALAPTGKGRNLNYHRQLASLKALRALIVVVHERGYRISEWLRWAWASVDLPGATARMLISKPDRWVDFDLSPQAVAVLAELPKTAGRVFPWIHRSNVYQAVDRIAPAGVHWRPHDSRRAVVTAILRNTGDPTVARDYVGHASIKTTLRYRVVEADDVRPSVRQTARKR